MSRKFPTINESIPTSEHGEFSHRAEHPLHRTVVKRRAGSGMRWSTPMSGFFDPNRSAKVMDATRRQNVVIGTAA
jgi:hypothetical protein